MSPLFARAVEVRKKTARNKTIQERFCAVSKKSSLFLEHHPPHSSGFSEQFPKSASWWFSGCHWESNPVQGWPVIKNFCNHPMCNRRGIYIGWLRKNFGTHILLLEGTHKKFISWSTFCILQHWWMF